MIRRLEVKQVEETGQLAVLRNYDSHRSKYYCREIHVALKIGSDDREDLHKNCDFLTNQIELRRSEAAK